MEFLQEITDRGYPTDYLISRVRGRRALLLKDWDNILLSPDISEYLVSSPYREFLDEYSTSGIRKRYQWELQWIYKQMNRPLRDTFKPFFVYSELDTLLSGLRYHSGKGAVGRDLLSFSLLSEKVRNILGADGDLPFILAKLGKISGCVSDTFAGLSVIFAKEGLTGVEQKITGTLFNNIMRSELHPIMKRFFISVIDSENIITLYKHLKWDVTAEPLFLKGGSIGESVLKRILNSHEVSKLLDFTYKYTGGAAAGPGASIIESMLRKGIARQIKVMARECPDIGPILDYLWRFSMEARNLSILSYAPQVDKDILEGELVH